MSAEYFARLVSFVSFLLVFNRALLFKFRKHCVDTREKDHHHQPPPPPLGTSGSPTTMTKSRPLSLQVVDLKVRMCCEGCERVVKNAILKIEGVDSVEVDLEMERVTVTGYVDRNKVLKEVRRSGKRAEFWPNPDLPRYFTTAPDYFRSEETFRDSYNYWRHGYNDDKHGHVPVPLRGGDRASNIFNDDDVNACAVM